VTHQHVDQHLGRAQIGRHRFVDELVDDRVALSDLAPLPFLKRVRGLPRPTA
jgi:hypothetical protein